MFTIGFIMLFIAGLLALLGFGILTSPVVGPVRVAFYFVLILSLVTLFYGVVQQEAHVNPRVPTQEQN
ncbi:MAG: DUF1328 domain-containing protein [Nitrospira sp.]|nr:DUF1328 domain-containing protein [Nitrospira sp.]HBP86782.1 DUF1328 domain-containing protein [Nitrospiraceae bacterium]HNP27786.1 DUF1328 domain-containing protein [Nitrospirales bacterium]